MQAALLVLLLPACAQQASVKPPPEPFVFRALDLRQQDTAGPPAWELTSPEARYDITRRVAQARQPRGVIYLQGKPRYRISARSGTVIGDGQAVQLEGEVSITLLGKDPVHVRGDLVRWLPRQNLMLIDRRPVATDRSTRLRARTARFLIADDRIELRGTATLDHWDGAAGGPPPLSISTASVDWKPNNGALQAPRAVQGQRRRGTALDQTLTASGLQGNLREGFVDLLAPVQVLDGGRQGLLKADRTRWAINDQMLSSGSPFTGQVKRLKAQGARFVIDLRQSTLLVPQACALQQPDETLNAERCLWHWPSGRFDASGDVVLRRQTYKQVTRASVLQGQIGKDGTATFTAPGTRVLSRFTLPRGEQSSGPSRSAAPPVTF